MSLIKLLLSTFFLNNTLFSMELISRFQERGITDNNALFKYAIINNNLEAIELILKKGANINKVYKNRMTPLILAANLGYVEIVKFLLNNGSNINYIHSSGESALMFAAMKGHEEIIKILLANGADVNIKTNFGATALSYALFHGHENIVKLLIAKGAKRCLNK